MRRSGVHFIPLALPFFFLLFFLIFLLVTLIEFGILGYTYEKIGINQRYVFALLFLSLAGSYINIPVTTLPSKEIVSDQEVTYFGMRYVIPKMERLPKTIIAVNFGGAIVPALLSFYLLVKHGLYLKGFFGVAIVAFVTHRMAQPVRGLGIAIPVFIPPLIAAMTAILLSWKSAPPLAYISGTLGTLIGADILSLNRVQGLGAPVVSIGGAGTFDGIFLTGILAVLLAS
jgi:uncharacterized membrane protein